MRRILLHITFWVIYGLQDTLLAYTWVGPSLKNVSDSTVFWMSFADAFLVLIPKLIITYFVMGVSIKQISSGKYSQFKTISEIVVVLAFCIFIYRLLAFYVINPIYGLPNKESLINIRGVLASLMDIGFVSSAAVTIKLARIQLSVKEKEKHLVRDKLEAELKFLRNQTNPHFLLNTLNNVYALARKKSDDTAEVVMKLSELLRFILYESTGEFIPLIEEIKILEDYLQLEKMRYTERLTVSFEKQLDGECYQITPLLLLPFIENAFKHGISESRFESYVHIAIRVVRGQLIYTIENSKDDTSKEMSKKNIGLANVRRRLELTYKEYELDLAEEANSYKVSLSLNLDSHVEI
jgi:two-component system, LytTR family, sensor kinase